MGRTWSFNSICQKLILSAPHYAFLLRALGQPTHEGLNISEAFLPRFFFPRNIWSYNCIFQLSYSWMFLRAVNELQLKQWILQAPEGSVYVYTVWGHPCRWVSAYCSLNLRHMHVLLCFTNKLEGNSAQVSCALDHFCQIPALCFPLHQVCPDHGRSVSGVEGGQVQAGSARIASGETGTSTSPEGLLWPHSLWHELSSQFSTGLGVLQALVTRFMSSHARIIFCLATHELNFSVSAIV